MREEVVADAVRDDRDSVDNRDAEEVVDLRRCEELGLIDEQAGHVDRAFGEQLVIRGVLHASSMSGEDHAGIVVGSDEEIDLARHAQSTLDL